MQRTLLLKTIQVLFFFFLVLAGLHFAKPFLVPLCFAGLLAMLFLPLSVRLENRGIHRALSALICILIFLAVVVGLGWLLTWQISDLAGDITNIEKKIKLGIRNIEQTISKNFGITPKQQEELIQGSDQSAGGMFANIGSTLFGVMVDFILVIVYTFLFIYFRTHLKKFIVKLIPSTEKQNTNQVIHDIQKVSQQYLTGLGMMIACLWIMYSIGFSIVGLKNAIFFAILCGLLEIVPFVGNLTGNAIAIVMAITQGGGVGMVVGILITYATIQFLQTYLLEPLVVGAEVNINPLFTILVIVLGELLWGVSGMILAIPLLGITKIICDHVEPLKPYGFVIGQERKKKTGLVEKIRKLFKKS